MGLAPLTGIPLPVRVLRRLEPHRRARLRRASSLTSPSTMPHAAQLRVPDRRRRDGGSRAAVARGRGGAERARRARRRSPARLTGSRRGSSPRPGFELDPFRVEGLPRRPASDAPRARSGVAARAPAACVRILRRRRPDVVLGGGGYVGRPDGAAPRGALRIPAALTEADAHLGLANRLAAPFARRVFLAFPIDGREGPKYRVVGRPIPRALARGRRGRGARRFGLPSRTARSCSSSAAARARARLNEAAFDAFAADGPGRPASLRRARLRRARAARVARATTGCSPSRTTSARRSPPPTSSSRGPAAPSGRSRRPASRRCSSRTRTRRPTTRRRTRATSSAAAARSSSPRQSSTSAGRSTRFSPTPSGSRAMGEAMLALARPDAADVVAEELIALAAARGRQALARRDRRRRACRRSRSSRKAWGAEVGGLGPGTRRRTSHASASAQGSPSRHRPSRPRRPPDAEVVVSTAYRRTIRRCAGPKPRGELLAELVALRPSIVVAGAHGKTTTAAMIAFVLDRLGHDPAFLIGGEVPQLGGNARAGDGWLVAEGDESRPLAAPAAAAVAVVTNVELDHHATFASRAEVEELFDRWLAGLPTAPPSSGGATRARSTSSSPSRASTTG